MSSELSLRIRGIAEIQRALYQFNARLGERVTRLAMRKGANYMLKQVRAAAPVKTGRLKKAIRVKNSRINTLRKNGNVGVYLTVNPGKNRNDPKGAWYGKFVENGYNTGSKHTGGVRAVVTRHTRRLRSGATSNYSRTAYYSRTNQRTLSRDYRMVTSTSRFSYRSVGTGNDISGQHFILNTFNATAPTALEIMIEASEVAMRHLAQELNLNTTG